MDESATNTIANTASNLQQLAVEAFRGTNQQEVLGGDHAQRLQRALERRQHRLHAKVSFLTARISGIKLPIVIDNCGFVPHMQLALEAQASKEPASSVAV